MKLRKLFLFGTLVMFGMAGKSQNVDNVNDCQSVEEVVSVTSGQVNLELWPTCTANEMAVQVSPKLVEYVMYETGDEALAQCFQSPAYVIKCEDKLVVDEIIAKAKRILPKNIILLWSAKPQDGKYTLYAINDENADGVAPLHGDIIEKAETGFNTYSNAPIVNFKMNSEAAAKWADMTEECAKERRPIAIVVNGQVLSAPIPSERINGGACQISGDFTIEEVQNIVDALK